MPVFTSRQLPPWLGCSILGCLILTLAGCGTGYPTDLVYPHRTDLLVIDLPKVQPTYNDPPGQLDRAIALIGTKETGGATLDPKQVKADDRKPLDAELAATFGTPAAPKVVAPDDEAQQACDELQLGEKRLAKGSELYRRHCLHCHGLAGDGRGPSGPWLNPHPRDYRQGQFKFMSSKGGETRKPRRADLVRTVHNGIESTSMPAFNVLLNDDTDAVISYVIHLSIRGEVEFNTIKTLLTDPSRLEDVATLTKKYLERWKAANDEDGQIKPKSTPDFTDEEWKKSVRRGYDSFTDTKGDASCIACHADYGRQVPFRYEAWGTLTRPANLTVGVYRGGRRPIDLYWRIKGGIVPSGMPAVGSEFTDERIWDLVNFLEALPHPRMLPEDIRRRIYVRDEVVAGE